MYTSLFKSVLTIVLISTLTHSACCDVVQFRNMRMRVSDNTSTSTTPNDLDGDTTNESVKIANTSVAGFDIKPIDPNKPVAVALLNPYGGLVVKLTNVEITATADEVSGDIQLDGYWDNPPFDATLVSGIHGTSSYAYDPNRPQDDYFINFTSTVLIEDVIKIKESSSSRYSPGGPINILNVADRVSYSSGPLAINVGLSFYLSKTGDSFKLPESFVVEFVPTPTSSLMGLTMLTFTLLRKPKRRLQSYQ